MSSCGANCGCGSSCKCGSSGGSLSLSLSSHLLKRKIQHTISSRVVVIFSLFKKKKKKPWFAIETESIKSDIYLSFWFTCYRSFFMRFIFVIYPVSNLLADVESTQTSRKPRLQPLSLVLHYQWRCTYRHRLFSTKINPDWSTDSTVVNPDRLIDCGCAIIISGTRRRPRRASVQREGMVANAARVNVTLVTVDR